MIKKISTAVFCLLLWTNLSNAQINRPYEPIVLTGDTLPQFSNYEVQYLYLYAYDANTDSWRMIPFQIDEVNPEVEDSLKYFIPEDSLRGVLDNDDELVFILGDIDPGDKADSTNWIDGADSLRYEICLYDTLDDKQGYVYLYFSKSVTEPIPDVYAMNYDSLTDRVFSANYEIGFNNTGQLGDVIINSEIGGSGTDVFDRIKIRLFGIVKIIFPYPLPVNEDAIQAKSAYAKSGLVRIIRNLNARFYYKIGNSEFNLPLVQTSFFYPWSSSFSITGIPIDDFQDYADIIYARLSWDMNENASGMYFYSEFNRNGIMVDGLGDYEAVDFKMNSDDFNWTMITGSQGTMLNMFFVPALGDSQGIFYWDNSDDDNLTTGDPPDVQPYVVDTGDAIAYGDCGYFLYNNIIGEEFSFIYHNFFLPPGISPEFASQLCNQARHPIQYITKIQKYEPPSNILQVESSSKYKFELYQNYPNPFNSSTVISFSLSERGKVSLIIYDILGKQIKTVVQEQLSGGVHKYIWSGKNDQGESVPSGLYFYKLKVKDMVTTKKILLVK